MQTGGISIPNDGFNYEFLVDEWSEHVARIRKDADNDDRTIAFFQHEIIGELVEKMIPLVVEFGQGKGYDISEIQAEVLCWVGLEGTQAYRVANEDGLFSEDLLNVAQNELDYFEPLSIGKICDDTN